MKGIGVEYRGHPRTGAHLVVQQILGISCYLFFVLPYARRILGLERVPREHRIFACNHVSLLDTVLLGGIFYSKQRLPILVLGDAHVWKRTLLRRFLSAKVGFLIERGKSNRDVLRHLKTFGDSHDAFNLLLFPEGTRGDGVQVADCQPGVYTIAQAARIPIVPVFISGMQKVSSKLTPVHPFSGLKSITVEFGPEISAEEYGALDRAGFSARIRGALQDLAPTGEATNS